VTLKELQATLETVSTREQDATRAVSQTQREKAALELRLRDLEANLQQVVGATAPGQPGRGGRPRASSLSGIHISALERELSEARVAVAEKQSEVQRANGQATAARADVVRVENEAMAMERRLKAQVQVAQEQLAEREEEMEFLRSQQGGTGRSAQDREEELMQRIEADETTIATLEKQLAGIERLEVALAKTEKQLKAEVAKVKGMEGRLARESKDGQRDMENARSRLAELEASLRSKDAQIASFNDQERSVTWCTVMAFIRSPCFNHLGTCVRN
jgi:chromosome segregation ATPase